MPSHRLLLPGVAFLAALAFAVVAFTGDDGPVTVDTGAVGDAGTGAVASPSPGTSPSPTDSAPAGDAPSVARMAPLRLPTDSGMTIGDPDAPLVMVSFESFGCLWCGNFHRLTLPGVLEEHVADGTLRIESRMLPYEQRAVPGARIGAAAGLQDRYWALAEHLYPFIAGTGEPPVGRDLTADELGAYRERQTEEALLAQVEQVADEIDLDWDRFRADYASDEVASIVARDQAMGSQLGFTGTPAFVVNGVPVGGYMGPERFREFLDAVLDASTSV